VSVRVTPIARSLGAIVSGVDLRDRLSDEEFAVIDDALMQHLVLFFREQDIDDAQHLAFASRFGTPNVYPTTRARGLDVPIEFIEDAPDSPPKADLWHTDAAFHFGLRDGEQYVDPAPFIGRLVGVARLVPADGATAAPFVARRLVCGASRSVGISRTSS